MNDRKFQVLMAVSGVALIFSIVLATRGSASPEVERITFGSKESAVETAFSNEYVPEITTVTTKKVKITTIRTTAVKQAKTTTVSKAKELPTEPEEVYLDINTASLEEFQKLNGIGPVIAGNIIQYREEHGRFNNIDELKLVSGIGDAVFEEIRENVYVIDPVWPVEEEEQTEEYIENIPESSVEIITEPPEISDESATEEPAESQTEFPIDVNSAEFDELMKIPGMDETAAVEILDVREKIGRFESEYELLIVKSLSRERIVKMLEYITFGESEE